MYARCQWPIARPCRAEIDSLLVVLSLPPIPSALIGRGVKGLPGAALQTAIKQCPGSFQTMPWFLSNNALIPCSVTLSPCVYCLLVLSVKLCLD